MAERGQGPKGEDARVAIPDFTHRKDEIGRLSGALSRMTRALYQRIDATESFAADVAHEIKNPLAGITGAAQLLSMNLKNSDLELTDLIVAESRRIVKLLEQVEQFGNLSPPDLRAVNLHDVLDRARRSALLGFGAQSEPAGGRAGRARTRRFRRARGQTQRATRGGSTATRPRRPVAAPIPARLSRCDPSSPRLCHSSLKTTKKKGGAFCTALLN